MFKANRRRVFVRVPEEDLLYFLLNSAKQMPERAGVVFMKDLPEGAEVLQVYHDPYSKSFCVHFAHESFPEVPCGEMTPQFSSGCEMRFMETKLATPNPAELQSDSWRERPPLL